MMRVERPGGAGAIVAGKLAGRGTREGFAVAEEEAGPAPPATTGVRSVGSIDVLIALQGIEEPGEQRRRAVRRGRSALDVLDNLKIGLLAGGFDSSAMFKLKAAAAGLKEASGDPLLDGILSEIELRVEVELAKMAPQTVR
jgi:Class II flagellar assembly regulator